MTLNQLLNKLIILREKDIFTFGEDYEEFANLLLNEQKEEEFLEVLQLAKKRKKTTPNIFLNLLVDAGNNGKPKSITRGILNNAIEQNQIVPDTFVKAGVNLFDDKDDYRETMEVLELALEKNFRDKDIYGLLIWVYLKNDRMLQVLSLGRRAIAERRTSEEVYTSYIAALMQEDKKTATDKCLVLGLEAIAKDQASYTVIRNTIILLYNKKRPDECLELALKFKDHPEADTLLYNALLLTFHGIIDPDEILTVMKEQRKKSLMNASSYEIQLDIAFKNNDCSLMLELVTGGLQMDLIKEEYVERALSKFVRLEDIESAAKVANLAIEKNMASNIIYISSAWGAFDDKDYKKCMTICIHAKKLGFSSKLLFELMIKVKVIFREDFRDLMNEARQKNETSDIIYDLIVYNYREDTALISEIYNEAIDKNQLSEETKRLAYSILRSASINVEPAPELGIDNYEYLIINAYDQQNFSFALEIVQEAVNKGLESDKIILYKSLSFKQLQNYTEQVETLESGIARGFKTTLIKNALASAYKENGKKEKSKAVIEQMIEANEADEATYALALDLDRKTEYFEALEQIVDKKPTSIKALFILAMNTRKQSYNDQTATDYFKKIIQRRQKDAISDLIKEEFHASHSLNILNEDFNKQLIIKKGQTSFSEEIKYRDLISKAINMSCKSINPMVSEVIKLPEVIAEFRSDDSFYYVMTYERGAPYTDLINAKGLSGIGLTDAFNVRENDLAVIETIFLSGLAKIYSQIPGEELSDYDFRLKLQQRNYEQEINEAMEPFIQFLERSTNKSYYPDPWTDNLIIGDENIIIVDTENRGRAPIALSMAQFLGFVPAHSFEETVPLAGFFFDITNNLVKEKGKNTLISDSFILEYAVASVYRSLLNVRNRGYRDKEYLDAWKVANFGLQALNNINNSSPDFEKYFGKQISVISDVLIIEKQKMEKLAKEEINEKNKKLEDVMMKAMKKSRKEIRNFNWEWHAMKTKERRHIMAKALFKSYQKFKADYS